MSGNIRRAPRGHGMQTDHEGGSMITRPCNSCLLRKQCPRFNSIRWTFGCQDLTLRSLIATMKCDWHENLYSPGIRVSVRLHEYQRGDGEYSDYEHYEEGDYAGTISRINSKGRVVVWMDENDNVAHTIITVQFGRITPINEPPINVCLCGRPEGEKNRNGWSCDECDNITDRT